MFKKLVNDLFKSGHSPELVVSTVAINVLALGSSLYSIQLLNRYVTIGLTPTLISLTVGVVISISFELMLRRQRQNVLGRIARGWDESASARVFKAFSASRFEPLSAIPLAERREALAAPAAMQQLGSTNNLGSVLDLPFVFLFILAASLLYWPFGVFAALGCGITLLMGIYGERNQRTSADDHAKANSRAQQMGQFLLSSGEAVRALPLIGPLSRRWGEIQDASLGSRRQGMDLQSTLQTSIQSIGQLLTVLVYGAGAIAVVRGDLTTGALIGANILVSRAFAVTSRAAYLADPLLRATRADAALKKIEAIERETETGATPRNLEGALELVDVAFSYPQQPVPLFERLDLSLAPGQVLVISGPNGAGKSTLVKLMLGLLTPKRGLVRADRIELRQLSQDWWRARVGYAPQEAAFFDGTLRENLLLDREIDDGVLLDEIRAMGLDSFLAADPNGLDRPISSHETGLAMGLRRRFVLIRAVLGNPDVIFLDDPTEGLDQAGQAAVAQLLNRLVKQRKTLVVASNEAFILRAADLVVDMTKKPTPTVTRPVQNLALTAEPTVVS